MNERKISETSVLYAAVMLYDAAINYTQQIIISDLISCLGIMDTDEFHRYAEKYKNIIKRRILENEISI